MSSATAAPARLPLGVHVREARTRAVRAAVALAIGVIAGFALSEAVLDLLRVPITEIAASRDASLNYDSITGAFDLRLRIALIAGVALSSPVWIAEVFGFLAPGLTRREKRYVYGFFGAALPLFLAGSAMGLMLFPHMVELLASFASSSDSAVLDASTYVDFALKIVVTCGLAFVLPALLVLLNAAGLVSSRAISRRWRAIVIAIVLFSALATPSADVLSMFAVAIPLTVLFAAAVGVTRVRDRAVARRTASLTV